MEQNKNTIENGKAWNGFTQKLNRFQPEFLPGFEQRLMQKLAGTQLEGLTEFLPVFRIFAFSGIAAIGLLMIGLYFSNGSLNLDSLLGISGYTPDMGLFSFL